MQEIVTLVKEKEMVEECKYQLENSISTITESICHAKSIKKDYLLETLEKRNVSSTPEDKSLLTLITLIELSSIQCSDVTPTVTSIPLQASSTITTNKETAETNIEEDRNLKITVYPEVHDHDVVPTFKKEEEFLKPSSISLNRNATQVW